MKKGFTLAEVLITLMIFGVIIVLILPSLFNKKDDNLIDNTRPSVKQEIRDNDCKVQSIEITDNGVSIKCKEY